MGILVLAVETSILQKICLLVVLFALYYVVAAIYNLKFHPLAKHPGPFWAKISGWPAYYHTLQGNRHIWMWQCQELYGKSLLLKGFSLSNTKQGPIFRYCPNGIVLNTPEGLHAIYEGRANVRKGDYYAVYPKKAGEFNTVNAIDKTIHARKRRVLNSAFSEKAMRSAEPFIVQNVDRWCDILADDAGDDWTPPRNMSEWVEYLVFDILGDLCFGKCFEIKEPGENPLRSIPNFVTMYLKLMHPIGNAPFRGLWLWLKPRGLDWLFANAVPARLKTFENFVVASLNERTTPKEGLSKPDGCEDTARRDMLYYILKSKDPDTGELGYTPGELVSEVSALAIAGSDTTSTVMAAMFFYLTRNPQAYTKVVEEVQQAFPVADEICSGPKLSSCRYLRAFINETLRMNPPALSDLNRQVLPGGLTVGADHFGQGTSVGTSLYVLHHDKSIFPDPFAFRPERWIPDDAAGPTAEDVARAEAAFAPFSLGPRSCVGKNLAYAEMTIAMAKVLRRFRVRRVEGDALGAGAEALMWGRRDEGQFQLKDAFVALRDGPMVQFKQRRPRRGSRSDG